MSRRNVEKQFITADDFIAVHFDEHSLSYYGKHKPSVDTPIQVRLYSVLPNVNYMIHMHCYIEDAPMTKVALPCGAIEEAQEVLDTIKAAYGTLNGTTYRVNLKGHGCIVMADNVPNLLGAKLTTREMPEWM